MVDPPAGQWFAEQADEVDPTCGAPGRLGIPLPASSEYRTENLENRSGSEEFRFTRRSPPARCPVGFPTRIEGAHGSG